VSARTRHRDGKSQTAARVSSGYRTDAHENSASFDAVAAWRALDPATQEKFGAAAVAIGVSAFGAGAARGLGKPVQQAAHEVVADRLTHLLYHLTISHVLDPSDGLPPLVDPLRFTP
jgi:hypothetical protein